MRALEAARFAFMRSRASLVTPGLLPGAAAAGGPCCGGGSVMLDAVKTVFARAADKAAATACALAMTVAGWDGNGDAAATAAAVGVVDSHRARFDGTAPGSVSSEGNAGAGLGTGFAPTCSGSSRLTISVYWVLPDGWVIDQSAEKFNP